MTKQESNQNTGDNNGISPRPQKQDGTEQRIVDATTALLMDRDFSAISMTEIAEQANISRATLYRHYATKEQIFSDASTQWAIRFIDTMRSQQYESKTVASSVEEILRKTVTAVTAQPKLMAAYLSTLIAEEELLRPDQRQAKALLPAIIQAAIGRTNPKHLELTASTLQHALVSNLIVLSTRDVQSEQVIQEMLSIARLQLKDVWNKPISAS